MNKKPDEKMLLKLKSAIGMHKGPMTLADAATKSGLGLEKTKEGLNYLVFEYRGNLSATSLGELLYSFPSGFNKPWEQKERIALIWQKAKKTGLGLLKFIVRSWISIVMVAYVVFFALILLGLTFGKSNDRDQGPSFSGTLMFHTLLRLVLDSLFWTFHPFSPFRVEYDHYYDPYRQRKPKMPFYERVNRFFFGPEPKTQDKSDITRLALQEIRAQKGRVGILDIMRVTGLSKDEADPFMAELMLNYDGDVIVSDEGGIYYEFSDLRKSALNEVTGSPPPIWHFKEVLPPFTGNTASSNALIAGLNGFNLLMSMIAISNSWTIEKFRYIFMVTSTNIPPELLPPMPEGTPILLGYIPFIFSSVLFLIPLLRAFSRGAKKREVDAKNGKRGLIKAILNKLSINGIKEKILKQSWAEQACAKVDEKEFTREIVRLGGEVELSDNDDVVFRFKAIEDELNALKKARQKASQNEAYVGDVVFSSAK